MKICFLSQEDVVKPQGGTGTYVRNISMIMAARGHKVHVITRRRDDAPYLEIVEGVRVHRVDAPGPPVLYSPLFFKQSQRKFAELNAQVGFDVAQGNMPMMSSWGLGGEGLPPVVETVHCTVREELKAISHTSRIAGGRLNVNEVLARALAKVWLHREARLLKRASHIISVSKGLKRELIDQYGYSPDRVEVIPNGVDYNRFSRDNSINTAELRRTLGIEPNERVILYLGRLMERKRVVDLVQALPQVLRTIPNARLVVVGKRNANAERIEQAAREHWVAEKVTMVDHVPYAQVPAYYAMADVYALPSSYEGFPFTVLEAMAAGTPVVASNIPGIDEQIVPFHTGLLHPVGDIDMIASHIVQVLEGPSLAIRLSMAGKRLVEQKYDWDIIGEQTEDTLKRVVNGAIGKLVAA